MGAPRGPAPTPTAILKRRGSRELKAREGEPTEPAGRPRCPHRLSPEARKIWKRTVPLLEQMGVLMQVDIWALSRYCEMLERWFVALAYVREHGDMYVVKDDDGRAIGAKMLPQSELVLKLSDALTKLEDRFGLNPSARTRLRTEPKDKSDDTFMRFFGSRAQLA